MLSNNPPISPLVQQALAKNDAKACSLEELEALGVYLHKIYWDTGLSLKMQHRPSGRDALRHIKNAPSLDEVLRERKWRMNQDFKFTQKNVIRFVKINNMFVDCQKKAFAEAKPVRQRLARRLKNQDAFIEDFEMEIQMQPYIHNASGIHEVLQDITHASSALLTRDARLRRHHDSRNLERLNWNDCDGLSHGELADYHICYAMHELYDHSYWSLPDILKITQIWTDVTIIHQHFAKVFGSHQKPLH